MKILVTGAAGFIGFHLVRRLLEEGHTIIGLDSINNYYDVSLKIARLEVLGISRNQIAYNELISSNQGNFKFVQLKLEDALNLNDLLQRQNFVLVYQLAAQAGVRYSIKHPQSYINSNIVGFANLIEAAKKAEVDHFIYASSSSVYGLNQKTPYSTEDGVDHPVSLYAASKKTNELIAHVYSHLFGLPTTGLRFFTVYGPWGRPDMAYFRFTKRLLEGLPIDIYNNGQLARDFTYIDDIVEGMVQVANFPPEQNPEWDSVSADPASSSAPYQIFNIGNNKPVPLLEFVETIERELGIKGKKNMLPMQEGDVLTTHADIDPLHILASYVPKTNLQDGIRKFIDWYKNYFHIS